MIKRSGLALFVGATILAVASSASATSGFTVEARKCSDALQKQTLLYVNAVQKQIRLSIKNNLNRVSSKCSNGFGCDGGGTDGAPCIVNASCGAGIECQPITDRGIASAINKAKLLLRSKIATKCPQAAIDELFQPNAGSVRCADPDTPANGLQADELAGCVLQGAIGDLAGAVFGDAVGEVLARSAPEHAIDSPAPNEVCGINLASVLQIGSEAAVVTLSEAGGPQPLSVANCDNGVGGTHVCDTSGQGVVGNMLVAPIQTFVGTIPVCLITRTANSGNGTPEEGTINMATGEQHSAARIETTVLQAQYCPICDTVGLTCVAHPDGSDDGTNGGLTCNNPGETDIACPPTIAGSPPLIKNDLDLSTEPHTFAAPPNSPGTGSTNPAGAFCGACDMDQTIGCGNDSDCVARTVCSGAVGSGCCQFGSNTGAFGVDSATTVSANGKRGPFLPQMAGVFCAGKTGDSLADTQQGLPGPVRLVQSLLNSFRYGN